MASFVTDNGLAAFVSALVTDNAVRHIGWGTGSGQLAAANDLAVAAAEARVAGAMSSQTTTTAGDTLQVTGTIVATAARAVTEVGVFDASGTGSPPTGGNMGIYGDFPVINLANGDSIAFTIQAVLNQA